MIPPRPTMTQKDRDELRAFFGSPEVRAALDAINRAHYSSLTAQARKEAPFWRDSLTGERLEMEAACTEPLDPSRPFPAPRPPETVARVVSPWPAVIAAILATAGFATLIAWYVSAALRSHA